MKRTRKTLAVAVAGMALVLGCASVGAAFAGNQTEADETAAAGAVVQTHDYSWEQWQQAYPDEVGTFFDGLDEVEAWDGKVHSHATLYYTTPVKYYPATLVDLYGTQCYGCKSTLSADLYETMGLAGFFQNFWDYYDDADWFDCGLCHTDGEPGAELAVGGGWAKMMLADELAQMPAGEYVCGQCHNSVAEVYGGISAMAMKGLVDIEDVHPWENGFGPDELMQTALDLGFEMPTDDNGVATYVSNHPDIELFQGSVHQSVGLTCIDCHAPTMEGSEGTEFTSHNFSSSPLESDAALETCLGCHAAQGVTTPDEMRAFVHDAQSEAAALEAVFAEKQKELYGLIADEVTNGGHGEDALDAARDNYTRGTWYVRYVRGGADTAGMKVAHNPSATMEYYAQAINLMDEGIALLA